MYIWSDLSMGLANKIAYKFATTMFTTFEQSKRIGEDKTIGAITKGRDGNVQSV